MKPKRRIWYEVSHRDYENYHYWCPSVRKWVHEDDLKCCGHSHAMFRTAKRAKAAAISLSEKTKAEVTVTRWFYRKGRRMIQEFVLKERQ